MTNSPERSTSILFNIARGAAFAGALFCMLTMVAATAQALTFQVLHTFTGGAGGTGPVPGLTLDSKGNLYGTTESGGIGCGDFGCGTVYQALRKGSAWLTTPIYSFAGGSDGASPVGRVVFGPDGALYGTTSAGGTGCNIGSLGCGTIFKLQPSPTTCASIVCPWRKTTLYRFTSPADGFSPQAEVVFDAAGNLYGTTQGGGTGPCVDFVFMGCGTVFKLTHNPDGSWSKSTLYSFQGGPSDGNGPDAGVVLDRAGNIYSTTAIGGLNCGNGANCGTVFELTPSGSGWRETVLHYFTGADGAEPISGLIADDAGNLYGTTYYGGADNFGTVYKLAPGQNGWSFSVQYTFTSAVSFPLGPVTLDTAGNLYGTTTNGGAYGFGTAYKLTPGSGEWSLTTLASFDLGGSSGGLPEGKVAMDAAGNLYSTSSTGPYPSPNAGVVWEITP